MAAFYAIYHGPQGLLRIALRVNGLARLLLALAGPTLAPRHAEFFDTVCVDAGERVHGGLASAIAFRQSSRAEDGTADWIFGEGLRF